MKSFKIKPLVLALATIPFAFSGCGGSGQDEGTASRVPVSGLSLDGYLARALVFQDLNGNRILDPFEHYAYTDDQGYFSYNPNTDVNYCTSSEPSFKKHCLNATVTDDSTIVSQGGIDLQTGEPFKSSLQLKLNVTQNRSINDISNINPVTTVLSYAENETEKNAMLTSLNLGIGDINRDYYGRSAANIGQQSNSNSDLAMLKATQLTQKIVSSMSLLADKSYAMADEEKLPPDTSSFVYQALAREIVDRQTSISNVVQNNIDSVATRAKSLIDQSYTDVNVTPPSVTTSLPSTLVSTTALNNMTKIDTIVDTLVNQISTVSDTDNETKARTKILDITVSKIVNNNAETDIDNIITGINSPSTMTTLVQQISKSSTNVTSLLNTDLSNSGDVSTVGNIGYSAAFSGLMNKRLALSDSSPDQNKDYSAVLYFTGDSDQATSGTIVACVRYIEGLNQNGTLKSGSTLGTYADTGTWAELNDGYSLMIDFEIANATRQAIIQYAGMSGSEHIYNTDIDNELRSWMGPSLPLADFPETIPTSDAECQDVLDNLDPIDSAMLSRIQS